MNWLFRILTKQAALDNKSAPAEQALLICLDGVSLPAAIYEEYDVAGLEDQLEVALGSIGEVDGHEIGPTEAIIYLYGRDAEAMFRAVEPVLRKHPLAQGSAVTIRKGSPGAPQREVHIFH
jgi:hypothetical protein